MPFAVRIVNYQHSRMLNICESNLVGKILKESELTLNINRSYFAERVVEENEAEDLLRKSSVINMVGKETIALSLKIGIGSSKGVKKIDGIPFLLVFKF